MWRSGRSDHASQTLSKELEHQITSFLGLGRWNSLEEVSKEEKVSYS